MASSPADRLRERIRRNGPIPFSDFMEEALYGEGGYYAREDLAIGIDGDFVTGSSHSPLFGRTTAELLRRLDAELERPADYLEVGYGGGEHLAALIESSNVDRRYLACDRIVRSLSGRVDARPWVDAWKEDSIEGLVFSYELFDAVPVHRLVQRAGGLAELRVGLVSGEEFSWVEGELSDGDLSRLVPDSLAAGQVADVADWGRLYGEIASRLRRGLIVTFDYGFERGRLFDARVRKHGTLACYRRQRVHRDAFADVGRQDLTAHVDFTALKEAGEALGFKTVTLTRQAPWLAALGVLDGLAERSPQERLEAMTLLDLDGMGSEIRVLVQARGVDAGSLVDPALLGPPGRGSGSSGPG